MKFYVKENGKLVERKWCDNLDCLYHDGREGIPSHLTIISREGKDYCCEGCVRQAPIAEALEEKIRSGAIPVSL